MPNSLFQSLSIFDFMPIYRAPDQALKAEGLFYTHPERAELAINHPNIQTLIYEVARKINNQRNHIYNVDDIAEQVTHKMLQIIIEKDGLDVELNCLQSPAHMGHYFKKYVTWRMKDLLKRDPYWKRWTNAEWQALSEVYNKAATDLEPHSQKQVTTLTHLKEITNHLIEKPSLQLSPLNRLKYMMLYCPKTVTYDRIHQATDKTNHHLGPVKAVWNAWQKQRNSYELIRYEDHKDFKKSRTFCTWILFKPHLESITAFENEPDSRSLRENRFNRPVNRSFHQVINQCAVYILLNQEVEQAEPLIGELLLSRSVKRRKKEHTREHQRRKRHYLAQLSKQLYWWSEKYSNKPNCLASIKAIARVIYNRNASPPTLAQLERIEHSVKSFNSN